MLQFLSYLALPSSILFLAICLPTLYTYVHAKTLGLSINLKTSLRYSFNRLGRHSFLSAAGKFKKAGYDIPLAALEQHYLESGDLMHCLEAIEYSKKLGFETSYKEVCSAELKGQKPLEQLKSCSAQRELILEDVSSGKISFDYTLRYHPVFPDYFIKGRDEITLMETLRIEMELVLAAWAKTDPTETEEMLGFTITNEGYLKHKLGIKLINQHFNFKVAS